MELIVVSSYEKTIKVFSIFFYQKYFKFKKVNSTYNHIKIKLQPILLINSVIMMIIVDHQHHNNIFFFSLGLRKQQLFLYIRIYINFFITQ